MKQRTDLSALAQGASLAVRARINAAMGKSSRRDANAKQGRSAQQGGASSEDAVEAVLRALMGGALGDYQRNDAVVKASGDTVLYRVAGPCDFTGILSTREGFAIEVKSGARLWRSKEHAAASRKLRDPCLTPRQTGQLFRYDATDCLALVAWVVDGVPRAMPWCVLTSMWSPAGCVVAAEWEKCSTLREAIEERAGV